MTHSRIHFPIKGPDLHSTPMPLIGTRDQMEVDDRAAPSKVPNNENGDKSIERVKQYVLIVAEYLEYYAILRARIAVTSQLTKQQ